MSQSAGQGSQTKNILFQILHLSLNRKPCQVRNLKIHEGTNCVGIQWHILEGGWGAGITFLQRNFLTASIWLFGQSYLDYL